MKPVLIFGAGEIAEVAHYYFTRDTRNPVAGFTVDAAYLKESRFCGLPVVPFEEARPRSRPWRTISSSRWATRRSMPCARRNAPRLRRAATGWRAT